MLRTREGCSWPITSPCACRSRPQCKIDESDRTKVAKYDKGAPPALSEPPNSWVMTPVTLLFYGIPLMRSLNARSVRDADYVAARGVGMADQIIVVTIPTASEVVRSMPRWLLVFKRSDQSSGFAPPPILPLVGSRRRSLARYHERWVQAEEGSDVRHRGSPRRSCLLNRMDA